MSLIDSDALMSAVMSQEVVDKSVAKRLIIQAQTVDAVQVVRCKDCKHFKKPLSPDMWGWCKKVSMDNKATVEDWFCADGERKDDAH